MKFLLPLMLLTPFALMHGQTDSPFAHAANAGWIDLKPNQQNGVTVNNTYLSGYAYAANFGWMHFGDGSPANSTTYANDSDTDYGVNRDSLGNLSGYAYAANIGWIDFSWTDANDPNGPRIENTGDISGYAYSANIGWIQLALGKLITNPAWDTDGDSIPDDWEFATFESLQVAGVGTDFDKDGQTDAAEMVAGTSPKDSSSYFHIISNTFNDGLTEVTVTFATTSTRQYKLEYNPNLVGDWTDSGLGTFAPDEGDSTTKTFSIEANTRQFIRVISVTP